MSERSYRKNLSLGVTGRHTPTCFTASGERITPHASYRPETHVAWANLEALAGGPKKVLNSRMSQAFDSVAQDHGLDGMKDLEFENIDSARRLALYLRRCAKLGGSVIADIDAFQPHSTNEVTYDSGDYIHAVGVKIVAIQPEAVILRSTWLTTLCRGVLTAEDLYELMQHYKDPWSKRFPFNDANITHIPRS